MPRSSVTVRSFEIIDIASTALAERSWPIDPFASVRFDAGRATIVRIPDGTPTIVDLASGETELADPRLPDGTGFTMFSMFPTPDGFIGGGPSPMVGRWVGSELVASVDLSAPPIPFPSGDGNFVSMTIPTESGRRVDLMELTGEVSEVRFSVAVDVEGSLVHQTTAGGELYLMDGAGTLRRFDANGEEIAAVTTEAGTHQVLAVDAETGLAASWSSEFGVIHIIDTVAGAFIEVPSTDAVLNLGFARNGELLAVVGTDGTVRLWDVVNERSAGLVWDGSGSGTARGSHSPPWYDAEAETLWVATSGRLVEIPVDPARWIEKACALVAGRELTPEEWDRFVPGDEPRQAACAAI